MRTQDGGRKLGGDHGPRVVTMGLRVVTWIPSSDHGPQQLTMEGSGKGGLGGAENPAHSPAVGPSIEGQYLTQRESGGGFLQKSEDFLGSDREAPKATHSRFLNKTSQ